MGATDRFKCGRFWALWLALMVCSAAVVLPEKAEAQTTTSPFRAEPIGQPGHLGVGIGGGTLSNGLTAKYYVGERHALQAFVGLWGFRFLSPSLGADYVQELGPLVDIEAGHLVWSIGGGVGTIFNISDTDEFFHFGISAVTGPVWQFKFIPLELGLDVRPSLIFGERYGGVRIGLGGALRWYFF